ncbi:phosphotransferase [bacterium]|nr:phosphotransferase [bacterium]
MITKSRLDKIDCDVLTPFVQKALESPNVRVTEWSLHVVKGDWTSSKRLVCRLFGRGKQEDDKVSWSIFLKVPNPTQTHLDVWHREPFQRELLLYQSGVLNNLPGGISAPRCLGVVEYADDEPWMWLEDIAGEPALQWPLERFKVAAHHFGILQGAFLAGASLPDYPWMDTSGWLRVKLANGAERIPLILERFQVHPLTKNLYNSEIGKRLRRLWADREVFFESLNRLPKSFCHGDFNYTNLFARRLPDGKEQTVAIDWQYSGFRQIGEDITGFIADSSIMPVRRKAAEPEDFTELILEGYLSGLEEGGWKGDKRIARFACLARLALPWSFNLLRELDHNVLCQPLCDENRPELWRKLDEYVRRQKFLLDLAEEARALLKIVKY